MHWIPDHTGRFRWRPYYRAAEIDELCERRIDRFLRERYGQVVYPVATDDLTRLIEQEAGDLDLYADLSDLQDGDLAVEGLTTFFRDRRPRVRICRMLSLEPRREARLRTTLAHELGHLLLHDISRDEERWVVAAGAVVGGHATACTPSIATYGQRVDWLEWQAGYACGALLMPREAVANLVGISGHAVEGATGKLVDLLQQRFLVSAAAAFVRLRQLECRPMAL